MTQARIIKRYANRKLYDTQHSRYVTLEQISEMIRLGDDVKIIDNKTKEDLTSVTLAQIIFEEEKKQRSFLSLQTMRDIIQNGGESFAQFVTEAQRRVTSILPRRKDGEAAVAEPAGNAETADGAAAASEVAVSAGAAEGEPAETRKRAREGLAALRELREWVENSQRTIDEWHRRVDDRIRHMVEGISPFAGVQKDVKALAERMAALEAKLDNLAVEPDGQDVHGMPEIIDAAHASAAGTLPGARVDMAPGSRNGIGSAGDHAHDTEAQ